VLLKRVALDGLQTPPGDVLDTIAQRITVNLRALEGALIRIVAFASLTSRPVDSDLATEVLDDLGSSDDQLQPTRRAPTVTDVQQLTCEAFGLTREELLSQ
jgi:chromosomal replication initiator protein